MNSVPASFPALLMTALLLLLALGVYLLVLGVTRLSFAQPGSRVI